MAERWTENRAGINQFLQGSEVDHLMAELASKAVAQARSIAPVGSPAEGDDHPGLYRDSIQAEPTPDGPGWRVFADDNKAHWIEYGNAHGMPRFQVLTRAMETIRGAATVIRAGG